MQLPIVIPRPAHLSALKNVLLWNVGDVATDFWVAARWPSMAIRRAWRRWLSTRDSAGMKAFADLERRLSERRTGDDAVEPRRACRAFCPLYPPKEPSPESCCGCNCANCVWTVYWQELEEYNATRSG